MASVGAPAAAEGLLGCRAAPGVEAGVGVGTFTAAAGVSWGAAGGVG